MPKLDRFRIKSARRLRSTMTDAERILWSQLWRIPVEGTHFRKQSPVGRYYADFVSHRLKLVIELDGTQHALEERLVKDVERDRWFAAEAYRVLRFWNNEIREELDSVRDTIYAAVEERQLTAKTMSPHPGATRRPSPSRGG